MDKKTPLYNQHQAEGGKMVSFAGYLLPVQYKEGIMKEHMAVRKQVGIFDVSHMGEVIYEGKDALSNLNYLLTNDFTNMYNGQVRYSPMCNEEGGVVDDLLVYRFHEEKYMLVINAANREKDIQWMKKHLFGEIKLEDCSDQLAQLAIQGPKAQKVLEQLTKESLPEKYYSFKSELILAGIPCLVSKTGYTGEDGYEIYLPNDKASLIWEKIIEAGKEWGILPCGLGARDTLRLEASMPLYGHEMEEDITPLETGLSFAVKMKKENFIGKKGIEGKLPLSKKRVGLKVKGRGIVREKEKVFIGEEQIGITTSGTHCPYLGEAYAMALLDIKDTMEGLQVEVEVRGRRILAEVVSMPFYKK